MIHVEGVSGYIYYEDITFQFQAQNSASTCLVVSVSENIDEYLSRLADIFLLRDVNVRRIPLRFIIPRDESSTRPPDIVSL